MNIDELNAHVEELKKEDISQYPSFFQMARNAIKQTWISGSAVLEGKPLLAKAEIANARLEICAACEFFDKEPSRCRKCGCFMAAKANLLKASCPINKWGTLTDVVGAPIDEKKILLNKNSEAVVPSLSLPPISQLHDPTLKGFEPKDPLNNKPIISLHGNFTEEEKEEFNKLYAAASAENEESKRVFKFKGFTIKVNKNFISPEEILQKKYINNNKIVKKLQQ